MVISSISGCPRAAVALLLLGALPGPLSIADEPLETEFEEQVEVRLVLLDVVVNDRDGDPVSGLTAEDFDVRIGGERVSLVSFDAFCDDAEQGETTQPPPVAPPAGRIALVFDYDHMHNAAETLEHAERMLREAPADVPHMIVTIGERLRIEQGFEANLARSLETLERMRDDPTLWAAHLGRLTEKRFFERMLTLFDLLDQQPGRTTVVLFSGPFADDGFTYDTHFERIAARAARTRTAFYTIDSGGLRTLLDPGVSGLGGPEILRRLAHGTGGRPTSDTNDLSVAYQRAARALHCSYTLGFHDPRPQLDRRRRVKVDVWRPGHRVAHPASYLERSDARRRRSLADSALIAPQLFPEDGMSIGARVVESDDEAGRRRVEISAVSSDPDPLDGTRRVRAIVRNARGTTIKRRRLEPRQGATFTSTVRLRPGRYELIVVLSDSSLDEPRAVRRTFAVNSGAADR